LLQLASSQLPTLNWDESLLRLALAALLGGLIGVERELREREAGLRTHLLVSLGSALFTIVGAYGFHAFLNSGASVVRADPTRIAAQIVTGIGFLGAGAIIRQGLSVRGLTTAATLWVVAAVGLAAGAGYYSVAVITTGLVLLALWPLRIIAYRILVRFRPEDGRLLVALPAGQPPEHASHRSRPPRKATAAASSSTSSCPVTLRRRASSGASPTWRTSSRCGGRTEGEARLAEREQGARARAAAANLEDRAA
jgi:MgtC family